MFNLDVDLEADDIARLGPSHLRRSSHRPRFSHCQAWVEDYTREVNDTHP